MGDAEQVVDDLVADAWPTKPSAMLARVMPTWKTGR